MSLRRRILLTIGLTLVALVAGLSGVSTSLLTRRFREVERKDAFENLSRAERSFDQMVDEVYARNADWGSWDDAYAFLADGNAAFARSNLTKTTLANMRMDVVVYADLQGRLFRGLGRPRSEGGLVPKPEDVVRALHLKGKDADPKAIRDGFAGVIDGPGGAMFVSIRPVLTSDSKGPARGWVVFGRLLGTTERARLQNLTRLDVEVRPYAPGEPTEGTVAPLDEATIQGRVALTDLDGRPRLMLTMRKPRTIYLQGLASVAQVRNLVIVAGVAFGLVILLMLERTLLCRLARLSADVASVETGGSVRAAGHDELGQLAERINHLLDKLRDGEEQLQLHNVGLERTIQERTREMAHQAFHDKLTGLPNRALFMDRIDFALDKAGRTQRGVAAMFIDLDNFKLVNDGLGHNVGDALLIGVAARLRDCVRPGDTVARMGGDEFTVLLEDLTDPTDAEEVAYRFLDSLRAPVSAAGREVFTSGSVGIAFTTDPAIGIEALMKNADTAMYAAKSEGKGGYAFYDARMDDLALERLELETALRTALERGEVEVYYQPLIDLASGKLKGAEALARWTHPDLGPVSPGRFVPIAEEMGLIVPIGYWVLEAACRQTVAWGMGGFVVSVNLSGKQLQRDDVVERVAEILERTGLSPAALKLEITESILMADREEIVEKMRRLKDLGVKLALDDFGTGYSSLATLGSFPIDTLKIDRAFICRLGDEAEATSIVEAIMALSRSMRMDVTGEGVETYSQLRLMQDLGCHTGQGYLFDRPLSAGMFERRLSEETELRWAA